MSSPKLPPFAGKCRVADLTAEANRCAAQALRTRMRARIERNLGGLLACLCALLLLAAATRPAKQVPSLPTTPAPARGLAVSSWSNE